MYVLEISCDHLSGLASRRVSACAIYSRGPGEEGEEEEEDRFRKFGKSFRNSLLQEVGSLLQEVGFSGKIRGRLLGSLAKPEFCVEKKPGSPTVNPNKYLSQIKSPSGGFL